MSNDNGKAPASFEKSLVGKWVTISLMAQPGKYLAGLVLQVEQYQLIVQTTSGRIVGVYKHAIESISEAPAVSAKTK